MSPDRLGLIDESYLVVETPAAPLHVASIGIFEQAGLCDEHGELRIDDIRKRIAARLGLLPRLRQRLAEVPLGLARPVWVDDDDFDIAHHVDSIALGPPHDEAALLTLVEDIVMQPLDRGRPLWHFRFVTGLAGGRVALVERAHHAMIDGVSGVDISLVVLDAEREAPDPSLEPWTPAAPPTDGELLRSALHDRWADPAVAAGRAVRALGHPRSLAKTVGELAGAVETLRHDGVAAPPCSLNLPLGRTRRLTLVRQRLDAVRAAGAPVGATVNDVVLAAVAGGLRDLFLARGEPLAPGRFVKVLIPVSVRDDDESMALGNRVGGLIAALPIGIGDPQARLRAVAAVTAALKVSSEAATADAMLQVADLLPPSLAHLVQRSVEHQPLVNLVVTNIPGPPFPLYALGSRMLEAFPVVPLGAQMSLEVAVLSYDGALNLCITSDRTACPDVEQFAVGVERAFAALGATWTPAGTES